MQDHQYLETGIRHFLNGAFSGSTQHFEQHVAEQVRCWGFPEFDPTCRSEYQGFFNFLLDVFNNVEWRIEQLLASDSEVLVCLHIEGIHHEEFMGLPATGCRLSMKTRLLFSLREGLITETWMYGKSIKLMTSKNKYFELQQGAEDATIAPSVFGSLCHCSS